LVRYRRRVGAMMNIKYKIENEISGMKQEFSLIIIDIDFFIRYCLKFSHRQTSKIMNRIFYFFLQEFKDKKIYHQKGADEFYILCEQSDNCKTTALASEVLKKFRKQRFASFLGGEYETLRMTFSAGIASYSQNGAKDLIFKKALTALFAAKSFRRNCVRSYDEAVIQYPQRYLFNAALKIETIAGKWGEAGCVKKKTDARECCFWEPQAIAISEDERLFVADQNNHTILSLYEKYIEPVAGMGVYGKTKDGKALKKRLNKPTGLCVHKDKVYIADTGNDMVSRLDLKTGELCIVCGRGYAGYAGDNGPAKDALLNKPGGVAVDRFENLYINDIANNVIRKINTNGVISTFAGNGTFGFKGDGGQAVQASFNEIYGICMDSKGENIYIADYFNHRIRKIDILTGLIKTVAGNGTPGYTKDGESPLEASLNRPVAVCVDDKDNIYIAESGNQCIRIILAVKNQIFTLAGGCGIGTGFFEPIGSFQLANPNSLAFHKQSLYILDGANNRICRIDGLH